MISFLMTSKLPSYISCTLKPHENQKLIDGIMHCKHLKTFGI